MRNILIIDDSSAEQFLYKHLFETTFDNITITAALDGRKGLETLEQSQPQPDCMLLDLNMPIMDGGEFIKEYAKKNSDIPLYVMVSDGAETKYKDALNHPRITGQITKPLDKNDLATLAKNINLDYKS